MNVNICCQPTNQRSSAGAAERSSDPDWGEHHRPSDVSSCVTTRSGAGLRGASPSFRGQRGNKERHRSRARGPCRDERAFLPVGQRDSECVQVINAMLAILHFSLADGLSCRPRPVVPSPCVAVTPIQQSEKPITPPLSMKLNMTVMVGGGVSKH